MKKVLTISALFLLTALLSPRPIQADKASCQARGGECRSLVCPSGYEIVYDSRGLAITCGYNEVCCKKIPDPNNQCEQAGGECFRSAPNPTLYQPLSEPCPDPSQSCYRLIEILQPCTSPGVCTEAPGGRCPSGTEPVPGDCSQFYGRLCCTEKAAPSLPKSKDAKLYCDKKGEATNDPDITGKLYTAIGCIPIKDVNEFIAFILRWAIGIGGGIAFLLIVFAGFQIMTSAGNPERLQAGRELLTSAIAGLILLIFSIFILRIIGVNILGIFKP